MREVFEAAGVSLTDLGLSLAALTQAQGANPLFEMESGRMTELDFLGALTAEIGERTGQTISLDGFGERFFDKLEVSEREFFEHGEKVIVVCRFVTRSRVNGSVQDFPMAQVVTVRKGKIVDFRPLYWNVPAYVAAARSARD